MTPKKNQLALHLPLHGGDVHAAARSMGLKPQDIHDFSTNANEFAHSLTQALVNDTSYPFDHYPDPNSVALTEAIARHENVGQEKILVGNGSSELIFQTLQALRPSSVLLIGPIFVEYARACEALNIPYQIFNLPASTGFTFARNEVHALWNTKADLAILCTPNNPTGVVYENLNTILEIIPCPRIFIDNTYREFIWDDGPYDENHWQAYQQLLRPGAALISLNSFTKFFNCAGVRLGYLVADRTLINAINSLRAPWTISGFAQELGCKFLNNLDAYRETLPNLRWSRSTMIDELGASGLFYQDHIFPGPSFITLALRDELSARDLQKHLLKQQVLIRVCDNITGMPPNYIRIQVRPEEDCHALYQGLRSFR